MRHISSPDGVDIAVWSGGSGPPLLLVHGATADHSTTWRFVRGALEQSFTVHAMDRRGRGASGDAPAYDLASEAGDVAAVVDALGESVDVVAHSFGALCALEGALLTSHVHRLVLYEGIPLEGQALYEPQALSQLETLLAAGDKEGALMAMFTELVGLSQEDVSAVRSEADAWAARLANIDTLPRELRAELGYRFSPDRFERLHVPVLLLVGERSPAVEMDNASTVARALPDARVHVLPGQGHAAMYTAPELFTESVLAFLSQ